ncbi:protein FAM98B-like [Drosophila busckii]|uniref:protein FAM98B-like n=1 Tax=Drosophila busckii TaxID=30019 RepID=UPI00083EC9FE|nr:protein FAM98B-like [Drosophila busckii]
MRLSLLALFGLLCLAYAMAEEEVSADEPVSLWEFADQDGHANEGDRDVRQWGGRGWGRGGGAGWGHRGGGGGWGRGGGGSWGHRGGGWGGRGGWGRHW